jgi:glyoxylase-like metal-dependent hydrolase (beta-lactamase superfamily II)
MKLADGIYAYIWRGVFENNSNMYYFGEPLNMLFDPGLAHHLDLRFDAMKKDGLDPEKVKAVVNTHCHPDHFEGSEYFMKKNIPVGMHPDEIAFVNEVGPKFFAMMGMTMPVMKLDLPVSEGTWKVGGAELEVFLTPGHSPGSICVYWPEKKALVCGDLIFRESVGRVDFPGGSAQKLKESIERISSLDIEYLLPGHMDYITGARDVKKNFDLIRQYVFSML